MGLIRVSLRRYRFWTRLLILLTLTACYNAAFYIGPDRDLTSTKPYADLIGAKYSIVADDLDAYGVYDSDNRTLKFIDLIPGVGVAGPEIAFRRNLPKGQVIRILSAHQRFVLFASGIHYVVAVENADLPQGYPVWLELMRGNEDGEAGLNPAVFRRLPPID